MSCSRTVLAHQSLAVASILARSSWPNARQSRPCNPGTVKLAVVVAPNGTVKSSKAMGGHPLLVNAAMDAVRQWKFEPAATESTGVVEFKFQPQN